MDGFPLFPSFLFLPPFFTRFFFLCVFVGKVSAAPDPNSFFLLPSFLLLFRPFPLSFLMICSMACKFYFVDSRTAPKKFDSRTYVCGTHNFVRVYPPINYLPIPASASASYGKSELPFLPSSLPLLRGTWVDEKSPFPTWLIKEEKGGAEGRRQDYNNT